MKIIGLDGSDFDWIGFTVVANLALTASGVGAEPRAEPYPDSPGGLIL